MVNRRSFLKSASAIGTVAVLAGCSGGGDGGGGDGGDGGDGGATATMTQTETGPAITFGNDGKVDFSLSPSVPQQNLYLQYGPYRDYMENELNENYDVPQGLDVEMGIGSNYSAVIQALGQGTADVAETGPFAAALGVKTNNAEVILQRHGYGSWQYKSIIATPKDSDITSLSDLSGKRIAFSDRLSTSGCLYPLYSMSKEGDLNVGTLPEGNGSQAEFKPTFAGGHVQSYTLLEQGQVDAAAMGGFVRDTPAGPSPDEFSQVATTLHEDTGLPRAPIVVSPELSKDAKKAVQKVLLNAPSSVYLGADGAEDTEKNKPDDDLWFDKVRKATVDDYQSVIDVANELGVGKDIFES